LHQPTLNNWFAQKRQQAPVHSLDVNAVSPAPLAEAAAHFIAESGISETFYVYDLGEVARLHNTWTAAMPRVMPHYAGMRWLCRCRVVAFQSALWAAVALLAPSPHRCG
jgi:hypothetical protein